MTTDPKEAATARLSGEYEKLIREAWTEWTVTGEIFADLADELARIAIEQGVVPAIRADRIHYFIAAGDEPEWAEKFADNPASPIPWAAVCAGEVKP